MNILGYIKNNIGKMFAGLTLTASLLMPSVGQTASLTLGTPLISFDGGTTTYTYNTTTGTGSFSLSTMPAALFDPTLVIPVGVIQTATSGTQSFLVNNELDSSGTLLGGVAGDDLVIEGKVSLQIDPFPNPPTLFDGILLTGEIVSFVSDADPSVVNDTYQLTFSVTGGLLSSFYPGGGVGINLTATGSDATGDFTLNSNGGAKGNLGSQDVIVIPDACMVDLMATCLVNLPPVALECAAKIAATTLLYTGADMTGATVTLTGTGTTGHSVTYTGIDLVSGVTVLSAATESDMTVDARPEDLGAKMTITINGVSEEIHTSCSVPYVAGQAAPQNDGSPSPNWTVVSFVDKNGLVVDPTPVEPATTCEIPPSGAGCYANGSPTSIIFEYTGGGCTMSDSEALTEGLKPPTCSGVINEALVDPQDVVQITATGLTVIPDTVKLGDSFTVSGSFSSSTTIVMTDILGGTETNTFHTSCSAPLEVGDVFGGMTIALYNGEYGGTSVDFFYKVTNTGDTTITDVLVDDLFDGDVPGSPIASMVSGDMKTLTRTVSLINSIENPVTVSAASGTAVCDNASSVLIHETPRMDKGSKGSKGSKRGSKKMKNKRIKGSHKRHKRSKGGHRKGSKGKSHYSGDHTGCTHL